jgi:hypothetical protein
MDPVLARKDFPGANPVHVKTNYTSGITSWTLGLTMASVFLLLGLAHGSPPDWPPRQPPQIRSQVNYDPRLSDPFFKKKERSRWDGIRGHCPLRTHTAKVFTSYNGAMRFSKAKLLDGNTIELVIEDDGPSTYENLRIVIQNGVFWSQYWHDCDICGLMDDAKVKWTTTMQALTLDKQVYHKRDAIKGKIELECVEENQHPKLIEKYGRNPITFKLKGVFKTIVK